MPHPVNRPTSTEYLDGAAEVLADQTLPRRTALRLMLKGIAAGFLADIGVRPAWALDCLCRNYLFDARTQCCTPSGVQPKNPIADLSRCPGRVSHPGYIPYVNGCGGQDSWTGSLIPDSFGTADFRPCCDTHDRCYETCNSAKSACDGSLYNCQTSACFAAYSANQIMLGFCVQVAITYYNAVSGVGQPYYDDGQRSSCDCCGTSSCPSPPCTANGHCNAFPTCNGSSNCFCMQAYEGPTCVNRIACAATTRCTTSADCPWGWSCVYNTCCGSGGYCAPYCGYSGGTGCLAPPPGCIKEVAGPSTANT